MLTGNTPLQIETLQCKLHGAQFPTGRGARLNCHLPPPDTGFRRRLGGFQRHHMFLLVVLTDSVLNQV